MQEKLIKQIDDSIGKLVVGKDNTDNTSAFFMEADILITAAIDDPLNGLKAKMDANNCIKKEFISSVHITENYNGVVYERPVIDLVQQGGGMYGIALLGYTYVMEKVGIRFYSHGGTSAGAINALFLASFSKDVYTKDSVFKTMTNPHQATKSEILTHIIANTEFSSFMERKGIVGKLQRAVFKNYRSFKLLSIIGILIALILLSVYGSFSFIFNITNGVSETELRTFDFIIGTLNIIALVVLMYILFVKILDKQFGINQGRVFYKWVDDLLKSVMVNDTKDLYKTMYDIELSDPRPGDQPRLVLITSNLTHNRIVKFPERAEDYWDNVDNLKPASYLRATMSLPFIFETFIPNLRHYNNQDDPNNKVIREARFVDGGMLSNFPIREFHRSDNKAPRFPTFGVLLSERKGHNSKLKKKAEVLVANKAVTPTKTVVKVDDAIAKLKLISLGTYIVSFLSTFRNFYDNDFLFGSTEITQRIETVDTKKYNWLNFWMTKTEKEGLFKEGVNAALRQLEKFDWNDYLATRTKTTTSTTTNTNTKTS